MKKVSSLLLYKTFFHIKQFSSPVSKWLRNGGTVCSQYGPLDVLPEETDHSSRVKKEEFEEVNYKTDAGMDQ